METDMERDKQIWKEIGKKICKQIWKEIGKKICKQIWK